MTALSDAALNLAAHGFRIFPCRWHSKEPLINDNLRRATTDVNMIKGWWGTTGNYNIAIATGAESNVWVLDIDGDEGEQTLRDLETAHGTLPPTVTATTGKGRHLYFRWSNIEIRNSQCRDDIPGLDVRGNGGYVIAPPSIHPSGAVYAWLPVANDFADAPQWLLDVITKHSNTGSSTAQARPPDGWSSFFAQAFDGSRRSAAMAKATGFFLCKNIDPMVALDLIRLFNTQRCEPPLDDVEVIEIVTRITRRELEREH